MKNSKDLIATTAGNCLGAFPAWRAEIGNLATKSSANVSVLSTGQMQCSYLVCTVVLLIKNELLHSQVHLVTIQC